MKTPVAGDFYHTLSDPKQSLEAGMKAGNKHDHGNWNPLPAPNLQLRPTSVLVGWGPACYNDSRLPSSLNDWLASQDAMPIG